MEEAVSFLEEKCTTVSRLLEVSGIWLTIGEYHLYGMDGEYEPCLTKAYALGKRAWEMPYTNAVLEILPQMLSLWEILQDFGFMEFARASDASVIAQTCIAMLKDGEKKAGYMRRAKRREAFCGIAPVTLPGNAGVEEDGTGEQAGRLSQTELLLQKEAMVRFARERREPIEAGQIIELEELLAGLKEYVSPDREKDTLRFRYQERRVLELILTWLKENPGETIPGEIYAKIAAVSEALWGERVLSGKYREFPAASRDDGTYG